MEHLPAEGKVGKAEGRTVIPPKIGAVTMAEEPHSSELVSEATINRTPGVWFACCCVKNSQETPPVKGGPTVGVDASMAAMTTRSDGTVVRIPGLWLRRCGACGKWIRSSTADAMYT